MRGFKALKLKQKLLVLICMAVFIIVAVQAMYNYKVQTLMKNKTEKYAESIVYQFEENLSSNLASISKTGSMLAYNKYIHEYLNTKDVSYKTKLDGIITENVKSIINLNEDIIDVGIFDIPSDDLRFFMGNASALSYGLEHTYNFKDQSDNKKSYSGRITEDENSQEIKYACFVPVFDISDNNRIMNKTGVIVIICNARNIKKVMNKIDSIGNITFNIFDKEDKVFLSNRPADNEIKKDKSEEGKNTLRIERTVSETGWKVVMEIAVTDVLAELSFSKSSIFIFGSIMVMLLVGIGVAMNEGITKPVTKMVKSINGLGERGIRERLKPVNEQEMNVIVLSINGMLDKIEEMTRNIFSTQDKLYRIELKKRDAELSTLQSQINPHFVYNTLECMRSIGKCHGIDEIVTMATAMSDILRYSIKGDSYVRISDELDIVRKYLQIMDIRFNGKIKTEFYIDEGVMEKKIIKMILQPVVENAIYHGLGRKKDAGSLKIKIMECDGVISASVEDDGKGMDPIKFEKIKRLLEDSEEEDMLISDGKDGIGIINIHKRIRLLYGTEFGLDIRSGENSGTLVKIKLPSPVMD